MAVSLRLAAGIPLKAQGGVVIGALGVSGGAVSQDVEVAKAAHAAYEKAISH